MASGGTGLTIILCHEALWVHERKRRLKDAARPSGRHLLVRKQSKRKNQ